MSYMNDDTDPFGVPYRTRHSYDDEEEEYTFKDLNELIEKEYDLSQKLNEVKNDKNEAITQLKEEIKNYVDVYAEIECNNHGYWKITTKRFKLSQLEKLKKDFDLDDIQVKCDKVECSGGKYEERIIISW